MKTLKIIGHILLFILLFVWQLPQNIIALIMLPFLGKINFMSYKKFCFAFKCSKMSGGISLGNFAYLDDTLSRNQASVMHEQEGHSVDSKIWGPLYLFIIGIPSIMWAWFGPDYICYYNFYTEKWANKHAGLEVDKYCRLVIKNKEDF